MNIIGRYLIIKHLEEELKKRNPERDTQPIDLSEETQQNFLLYANHFQEYGIIELIELVNSAVKEHLSKYVIHFNTLDTYAFAAFL